MLYCGGIIHINLLLPLIQICIQTVVVCMVLDYMTDMCIDTVMISKCQEKHPCVHLI